MTTPERGAGIAANIATAYGPGEFLAVDDWGNRIYAGTPLGEAYLADKAKTGARVNGIYLDDPGPRPPPPPPDPGEQAQRDDRPDDQPDILSDMRDGAWLDAQVFPPLEWAVPGIIPEGFGLLVAPPKAGKSWLAAGLGLASAAGGIALGAIAVGQRPVLYLALEDGHRRLQQRFRTIMANQPIPQGMHVIIHAQTHESDPDDYRVSGPQPWPYVRLISVSSQQPVDAATAALLPRTGRRTNVRQIRCGVGD